MANNPNAKDNLIPFVKGDPRINRLGRRVRGKDALRKEWEDIWAEVMLDSEGNPIIDDVTGKKLTRLKAQMRAMTTSTNIRKVEVALAYTFGKAQEHVDVTTGGEKITWKQIIENANSEADIKQSE